MKLNETEVSNHLQSLLGRNEDSFQQAWVDILEADPQTFEEITQRLQYIKVALSSLSFHFRVPPVTS